MAFKLTEEQVEDIAFRLESGESAVSIGKLYKLDHTSILYWKNKLEIKVSPKKAKEWLDKKRAIAYQDKMHKPRPQYLLRDEKKRYEHHVAPKNKYENIIFEKINLGLTSYQRYLQKNESRKHQQALPTNA